MYTDSLKFAVDWCNLVVDGTASWDSFVDEFSRQFPDFDRDSLFRMDKGQNFYGVTYSYAPAGYSAWTFSFTPDAHGLIPRKDPSKQWGLLISISGDGCRFIDSYFEGGLRLVLSWLNHRYDVRCSKIDCAMDIFDPCNPIIPLFQEFAPLAYDTDPGHISVTSPFRRKPGWCRYIPVYDEDIHDFTNNVYIGDRTSKVGSCCVYNKKVEIREGRLRHNADDIFTAVGCDGYWYRVEYRMKSDYAQGCFESLLIAGVEHAFYEAASVLFRFVDQIYDKSNLAHCPTNEVWQVFLNWLSVYSSEQSDNNHFVQLAEDLSVSDDKLTDVPYVPTLTRSKNWVMSLSKAFYKIHLLAQKDPEWWSCVLDDGAIRFSDDPMCRQFEFDLSGLSN